ncbi:type 1 glutamine amidotransferase domain-containing protein [Bacillus sp. RAR_GA_16]|uniref:type 1 glutamine amidotransferase domain-containing protein n=1 Tax=Bacillus sp. RAR_GA_16 TaxID=2876774 RepID=UPI001CCF8BBC|nr:type 1 glutamine amidotransferase domain-containing protein [Bacillus sp. RAR_GA_16]MCA0173453.1 type 1 glutamine amidotransferase [Bacillus sp. RAR_GA_16]
MLSKIAVLMTDMFEDVEYTKPAEQFKNAGHSLTVISSEAGQELTGKQGEAKVTADKGIDDVTPEEFDVLFIPGGVSPDELRADDRFVAFTKKMMFLNKKTLVICHGPQLLISAEVLNGRNITGFKSIQTDLKYAGANVFDEEVVVCGGNLVSSRNPDDIPAFIEKSLSVMDR